VKKITSKKTLVTKSAVSKYVRSSMQVYGSYVIGERAVADVRDGLKPVQRRILFAMYGLNAASNLAPKKSARIVGETIGVYHPHGDSAVYDTMVNMVHARNPLVEGLGNFGNRVGTTEVDPAAAYRYTEARLSKFGEAMMEDLEDVKHVPNFSGDKTEPLYIAARVPLLLANGSGGIAVGMSANLPPHNLGELLDATIATVKNPKITTAELLKSIKGPDHGYGVLVSDANEVLSLYKTGKGSLEFRCEYELTTDKKSGDKLLVVTSPAPGFSPQRFLNLMEKLQADKLIEYAANKGNKGKLRIEVAYKDVRVLKERLLPALHTSESYQFYAVARDGGDTLSSDTLKFHNLRSALNDFVDFRRLVERRRTKRLLGIARAALKKQRALMVGTLAR
jgi:DNA gyrase/topoisomerase IV subunit A